MIIIRHCGPEELGKWPFLWTVFRDGGVLFTGLPTADLAKEMLSWWLKCGGNGLKIEPLEAR